MNQYEKQKKAVEKAIRERIDAYEAIYKKAKDESRDVEEDERLEVEEHIRAIEMLKSEREAAQANIDQYNRVKELGNQLGPDIDGIEDVKVKQPEPRRAVTYGEQFVGSAQYKDLFDSGKNRGQTWSTGQVDLSAKGTLLEGISGTPGTGGAIAATVPDVVPGVVETLFQPLSIADLIPSGQVSTNQLRYVVEGTATSGAAGVAEGAAKPESTLALSTTDEPVKKIATSLTTSDEMLEDAAAVQSYINGRLSLFVRIQEETQILRGAGTNDLVGIFGRSGINTYPKGTADNNAVALFKALNGTRGSSFLEPDAIVMHPTDWQNTRLLKDTSGQFFGGGPFLGPYGGPQGPTGDSSQLSGAMDSIWGKPVVVTPNVGGAGTVLLGSFRQAAQLFRRGGLSVEASNSHSTYFFDNLVAIRAEERLALAVYRPGAFTQVTGFNAGVL